MSLLVICDILIFLTGVAGAILVGRKNKTGFIYFIISSILTIIIATDGPYWGLTATAVVFIVIDVYYYFQWRRYDSLQKLRDREVN